MSSVTKRIVVGSSLAAGVALILFVHHSLSETQRPLVPWLLAALLSLGGALELGRMEALGPGLRPAVVSAAVLLAVSLVPFEPLASRTAWLAAPDSALSYLRLAALVGVLAALVAFFTGARPLFAALLAIWVVPALYGWIEIDRRLGIGGLVILVVLSKVGDVFGYLVGRSIGRRRPFPGISPNKTVAGCVASLVAGVAAGLCFAAGAYPEPWRAGLFGGAALGLCLNLAAQAGDLLESWVKRRAGVKDSGTLFGPSGGVLDVVDSLLATTPLALVVLPTLL